MTTLNSVPKPFVIGIAGGTGAGKSDVAARLCRHFENTYKVSVLNQDAYYRDLSSFSAAERQMVNFDDPASLDHDLLLHDLRCLIAGTPIHKPRYCFSTQTRRLETDLVTPALIIVVEGLFAFWDLRLRSEMNYKLYLDTDPDLRFIRRLYSDMQNKGRTLSSVIAHYVNVIRPMHQKYVETTKLYADVVNKPESIAHSIARIEESVTQALSDCARPDIPAIPHTHTLRRTLGTASMPL